MLSGLARSSTALDQQAAADGRRTVSISRLGWILSRRRISNSGAAARARKRAGHRREDASACCGAGVGMSDACIQINGGILVCVPPSLESVTTWVLLEQEDWFEKEISFVRRMLRPGMRVIDIGANYGVYTLTMAKLVAPNGAVFAFEPAAATAERLRNSIALNAMSQITFVQAAVSASQGRAYLHVGLGAEHSSLSGTGPSEEVAVTTIDRQARQLDWGPVDFVKIDAEGEELNILSGASTFLSEESPLIMFEVPKPPACDAERALRVTFEQHGYDLYRLIGPDRFLVPLSTDEKLEGYELNLFACKLDRAMQLAHRGLLARPPFPEEGFIAGAGSALCRTLQCSSRLASSFLPDDAGYYQQALDAYATWRDASQPASYCYGALLTAVKLLKAAVEQKPSLARLSTLARASFEAGDRYCAAQTAARLIAAVQRKASLPDEPMLPPSCRYEEIDPGDGVLAWLLAATFEAFEQWRSYSSYFLPIEQGALTSFDWLATTKFASAPMERRRQLQRMRAGLQSGPVENPILLRSSVDNLNPSLWTGRR